MTLPASGAVSLGDVNTEIGAAATATRDMYWVSTNTKDTLKNMNGLHSRAWYQRNVDGNCNNGNCNCVGNCGNIQCNQCFASQCVNCTNCDTKAYLQANCNCACTYNCNANLATYNCNCLCNCESDRRLKQDIVEVGRDERTGLNLYEFRYKANHAEKYVGVMSDDVRALFPEAVTVGPDGFDRVNYQMLGLTMQRTE